MAGIDDYAQLMIELINRARADPVAEATRFGALLDGGLKPGAIGIEAKQPLAPDLALTAAAHRHGLWMLATNVFSHTGAGGSTPGDRMDAAGYDWSLYGENLAMRGGLGPLGDLADLITRQHQSLFLSPQHRLNMLKAEFREVGVSQDVGPFDGYNVSMVTANFGVRAGDAFLTGVVHDDLDEDAFYGVGEGVADVVVTAVGDTGTFSTKTLSTGGYALALPVGTYEVTYNRGAAQTVETVAIQAQNVKRDVVDLGLEDAPHSLALQMSQVRIAAAPDSPKIVGGDGDDVLVGGSGSDWIEAGDGNDRILGRDGADVIFAGAGDDIIHTGRGDDLVDAGPGNDIIRSLRGNDVLLGGPGNDTILGGIGDNVIDGGTGDDRMRGGPGRDTFIFDVPDFGHDRILDFRPGSDALDFRGSGYGLDSLTVRGIGDHVRIDVIDADASIVLSNASEVIGMESTAFIF